MVKFGKWIGGGLGFTLGGPLGALAGFFLAEIQKAANEKFQKVNDDMQGKEYHLMRSLYH